MLMLLFSLFALGSCLFIILIFGLLRAGRKADEREEEILAIILPAPQTSLLQCYLSEQSMPQG